VRAVARHAHGLSSIAISGAAAPYRNRLILYGTKRTLEVDLVSGVLVESRPRGGGRLLGKGLSALDQAAQILLGNARRALALLLRRERSWPGLRALVGAFCEAVRTGGPSPVPVAEGVRVTEIADRIRGQLGTPPRG
jgi:predicted dehydrogenase